MRLFRGRGSGTEYPIETELVATNEPIEVALSSTESRGSNDTERHGEFPQRVRSHGHVAPVEHVSAEWSEVLPGIEARAVVTEQSAGERGTTDTTLTIRVHPEACPVLIEVDRAWHYYSEYHVDHGGTHYAVRVVRRSARRWPNLRLGS
jgi:hypothetical protein